MNDNIRKHHEMVSGIITPPGEVDIKERKDRPQAAPEFPSPEYMRYISNKYYTIIDWNILKVEVLYENGIIIAILVHGRLKWIDADEIKRSGDMIGAHRVDRKTETNIIIDIGNNVKAANTDCWKKALNFYLNVCDDIYRYDYPHIKATKEDKEDIIKHIKRINDKETREKFEKDLENLEKRYVPNFKTAIEYKLKSQAK